MISFGHGSAPPGREIKLSAGPKSFIFQLFRLAGLHSLPVPVPLPVCVYSFAAQGFSFVNIPGILWSVYLFYLLIRQGVARPLIIIYIMATSGMENSEMLSHLISPNLRVLQSHI